MSFAQDMLAAPLDHWVHNLHDNDYYKDRSNPFFGEIFKKHQRDLFEEIHHLLGIIIKT